MVWTDTAITILVLVMIFLLAYSALRKQGIGDTLREIKDAFSEKTTDIADSMKYK